jgi:hypothetical protein
MTLNNLNATTPQLKSVENFFKAYLTLDLRNVEPFFSKDFAFQSFPKVAGLPDIATDGFLETYGPMFSLMTNFDVCIQHLLRARKLTPIFPRSLFTK